MSQLGVTGGTMALVEYNPMAATVQAQQNQQQLMQVDPGNVSAEEVGQLIHHLQEEIKIIKQQLENLPGYASGKL